MRSGAFACFLHKNVVGKLLRIILLFYGNLFIYFLLFLSKNQTLFLVILR